MSARSQNQPEAAEFTEKLEDGRIRITFFIKDDLVAEDRPQTVSVAVESKWIRKGTCFEETVIHATTGKRSLRNEWRLLKEIILQKMIFLPNGKTIRKLNILGWPIIWDYRRRNPVYRELL